MATAALPPTTVVNPTTNSQTNLEKIENFINEPTYKEILESSANFNTRLCIERRLRLPFIDTQTGVAQNHSSLFMNKRQRMPGITPGQIYSYPRQRWRKKRRQYLSMNTRAYPRHHELLDGESDMHSISQIENPALQDTDSKDSQLLPGEVSKEWFYDEQDMLEMENYDEPDPDSDLDYEESYTKRRRSRKGSGRARSGNDSPSTPGRKRGAGRGRGKKTGPGGHNYEPTPGDPDKPFACELCGARYKTRPGLTYHYGHSHKEGASDENSRDSAGASPMTVPPSTNAVGGSPFPGQPPTGQAPLPPGPVPPVVEGPPNQGPPSGVGSTQGQVYQDSYVSFLNQAPGTPSRRGPRPPGPPLPQGPPGPQMPMIPQMPPHPMAGPNQTPPTLPPNLPVPPQHLPPPIGEDPPMPILKPEKAIEIPLMPPQEPPLMMGGPLLQQPPLQQQHLPPLQQQPQQHHQPPPPLMSVDRKVPPSPYCDFCLGDSSQNRKTGGVEELVSCHDCGRSGHPTCLQFTDNMKVSVKKYRWQCIECKCCSVCGTSDNDDQLLFCDDCDRGYHMYCLSPPLENPPEGSWSCKLCIEQFRRK